MSKKYELTKINGLSSLMEFEGCNKMEKPPPGTYSMKKFPYSQIP